MLVYNTTYTMPLDDAREFVIWVHQIMLPKIAEDGVLRNPRLLRILSHKDMETECFGLQFDVEDSSLLHKWYVRQGQQLAEELLNVFSKRVLAFSTLMEEVIG